MKDNSGKRLTSWKTVEPDKHITQFEDEMEYSEPIIIKDEKPSQIKSNEFLWENWVDAMKHMKWLKKLKK